MDSGVFISWRVLREVCLLYVPAALGYLVIGIAAYPTVERLVVGIWRWLTRRHG